jgi:hypothetical protein
MGTKPEPVATGGGLCVDFASGADSAVRMNAAKPQVLCWQMCDAVHIDPATGKHYLMGCFSNIRARQFPTVHRRMVWFLTLTDVGVGKHELKVSMGTDMEALKPLLKRPFESQSPLHKINLINDMHNLPFETEGQYTIIIEVDEDPILATTLGVSG